MSQLGRGEPRDPRHDRVLNGSDYARIAWRIRRRRAWEGVSSGDARLTFRFRVYRLGFRVVRFGFRVQGP
eukprot:3228994-Rhodomonas_salina.2